MAEQKAFDPSKFITVDANLPCLNPNCKSHGAPHPNCKCYSIAGGPIHRGDYENRGDVGPSHFRENFPNYKPDFSSSERSLGGSPNFLGEGKTIMDHSVGFNASSFAEGGQVHYCHHCKPHHKDCEYYAEGGDVEANSEIMKNPNLAVEQAIANHGLIHAITKTGISKSENPSKPIQDFMEHSKKGQKKLEQHSYGMFSKQKPEYDVPTNMVDLSSHIDGLKQNPDQIFNLGGSLADTLPEYSGALAGKVANAVQYFSQMKPKGNQPGTLDQVVQPTKMEQYSYLRQLAIAEKPLSILPKIQDGSVSPKDVQTLQTIYPELTKKIVEKAFEKLAEAKAQNKIIPKKQRMGLSAIMGPLDVTQNPQYMQAIMMSAAGNTNAESQGQPNAKRSGSSQAGIKQQNKIAMIYATPLQKMEMKEKG